MPASGPSQKITVSHDISILQNVPPPGVSHGLAPYESGIEPTELLGRRNQHKDKATVAPRQLEREAHPPECDLGRRQSGDG